MKSGDLVVWNSMFGMNLPSDIGFVLEYVPFEFRGSDPFPHWKVLFPDRGILHCRESDLSVIHEIR
jgi:hypothetical protein